MNQPTPTSPRGIWKATVRGVADVIVGRDTVNGEPCWSSVTAADGNYVHGDHLVTDLRPLVVLDPESTEEKHARDLHGMPCGGCMAEWRQANPNTADAISKIASGKRASLNLAAARRADAALKEPRP